MTDVKTRMQAFRTLHELSQEGLARQMEVSLGTVSRLERGKVKRPSSLLKAKLREFGFWTQDVEVNLGGHGDASRTHQNG